MMFVICFFYRFCNFIIVFEEIISPTFTDSTTFSTSRMDLILRRVLFREAKKASEKLETFSAGRVTSTSRNAYRGTRGISHNHN